MEITVEDYGKILFRVLATDFCRTIPDHWKSIQDKATPLIEKLIALNDEMINGGYQIVGHKKNGKKVLSEYEKIEEAQRLLWGTQIKFLKVNDLVWTTNRNEPEMYIYQDEPGVVLSKDDKYFFIEIQERIFKFSVDDTDLFLVAPKDWKEKENLYVSKNYWLEKALELNL